MFKVLLAVLPLLYAPAGVQAEDSLYVGDVYTAKDRHHHHDHHHDRDRHHHHFAGGGGTGATGIDRPDFIPAYGTFYTTAGQTVAAGADIPLPSTTITPAGITPNAGSTAFAVSGTGVYEISYGITDDIGVALTFTPGVALAVNGTVVPGTLLTLSPVVGIGSNTATVELQLNDGDSVSLVNASVLAGVSQPLTLTTVPLAGGGDATLAFLTFRKIPTAS